MDDLQRQLKLRDQGKRCSYAERPPRAQQRVTRKKKGAHNWRKAIQKVAQLHEHIQATTTKSDFRFRLLVLAKLHQKFH